MWTQCGATKRRDGLGGVWECGPGAGVTVQPYPPVKLYPGYILAVMLPAPNHTLEKDWL